MTELRDEVATACRILANEGLVDGILGHVSVRTGEDELLIRCRADEDRGLAFTAPQDIRQVDFEGNQLDHGGGWSVPLELPIHTGIYRARPDARAVVHAHPPAALLAGLAGLRPRPTFGAFNIPAMRLAREGVPVYPRSVLITRAELADEMLAAMGEKQVCLLTGHGITVAGETVRQATVRAVDFEVLMAITVATSRLGDSPGDISDEDFAELPDLGSGFNDDRTWRALAAKEKAGLAPGPARLML